MLELREIGLFSGLSNAELEAVGAAIETREMPDGKAVCRQGDVGERLFIVAGGGVRVLLGEPNGKRRGELYFGPGGVFGEMSLISEMPVSATVVTARPTVFYTLDKNAFHHLLQNQPSLYASLTKLLVARVRHRSNLDTASLVPSCALIVVPKSNSAASGLALDAARALASGVCHYSSLSVFVDTLGQDAAPPLDFFDFSSSARDAALEYSRAHSFSAPLDWIEKLLARWRETAAAEQFLTLAVSPQIASQLQSKLRDRDAVLFIHNPEETNQLTPGHFGLADCAGLMILENEAARATHSQDIWQHAITRETIEKCSAKLSAEQVWKFPHTHALDRIVRWITRREIGVALGSGSARGFAHLAILKALEDEGIPIDCAFGTSIGGIVAAIYGFAGDAAGATEMVREYVASDKKVRDISWLRLPRSSLMAGRKVRRQASTLFGDATLADFHIPTATVAADLVLGERVVLDRGSAVEAVLATSAIPGIYPPVFQGEKVLVDGGIMSQVPADLLSRRRCALRLAVNVAPSPEATRPSAQEIAEFKKRMSRHFGLFSVLERSWDLLAWWHGAADAGAADIFLEPTTDRSAGMSFDSIDQMMEFGKRSVDARMEAIRAAAQTALRPGTP